MVVRSGNYTDEMTWAAAWLYKATNDQQYLTDAEQTYIPGAAWGFSWDEKLAGNMVWPLSNHYSSLSSYVGMSVIILH